MKELYSDIVILGGGPAGYSAAIEAARIGAKVVLIEQESIGGTCLNKGCIPTKALLSTSNLINKVNNIKNNGIDIAIQNFDWNKILKTKNDIISKLKKGMEYNLKNESVEVIYGQGKIYGNTGKKIKAKTMDEEIMINCNNIILTTGSTYYPLDIDGMDLEGVMYSDDIISIEKIPKTLLIIGGGAIGLEFATMFNGLGSKVTIVEYASRLLVNEDLEISNELIKILKRKGINIYTNSKVTEVLKSKNGLCVNINNFQSLCCENVLVAIGRKTLIDNKQIGDTNLSVRNNRIVVDEYLCTSNKNIYAAGDIIGDKMLAHVASYEGKMAIRNALGYKETVDYSAVPACIYTSPEIASVGITEQEAIKRNINIRVGKAFFRNNGRALTLGERDGFLKIIVEKNSHKIIGASIIGTGASEIIGELTLAVKYKLKKEDILSTIHPHPSLSEIICDALLQI